MPTNEERIAMIKKLIEQYEHGLITPEECVNKMLYDLTKTG